MRSLLIVTFALTALIAITTPASAGVSFSGNNCGGSADLTGRSVSGTTARATISASGYCTGITGGVRVVVRFRTKSGTTLAETTSTSGVLWGGTNLVLAALPVSYVAPWAAGYEYCTDVQRAIWNYARRQSEWVRMTGGCATAF